jgi:PelA/Pel-15E family pectate lyase
MRVHTLAILAASSLFAQPQPSREETLRAMRRAAEFFAGKAAIHGGYHYYYAEDLSYGRSEHGEGLTQIENQREATPRVAMAFLEAYDATGDRFYLEAARKAAHATVQGQLCSGGWDYLIEFDPAKRKNYPYRAEIDCSSASAPKRPPTTLDDNTSQATLRVLMRVDRALNFADKAIHEAAQYALESLLKAQYPNGAWPQRYSGPVDARDHTVKRASYPETWPRKWPGEVYRQHYTFNDNAISDDIDTLLEAARIYKDARYFDAAKRGGDFMLLAQMPAPQPAWSQQYDQDMHPAWARVFEPPSVTGGESQGIMRTLLLLYRETGKKEYLDAVRPALEYLEASILPAVANPSEARRRVKGPVLARFYELKTNRPLYITKGTMINARGIGSARIDGYQISYDDGSVINHYGVLTSGAELPRIRAEYERIARAAPASLKRPDQLHGLSPWHSGDAAPISQRPAPQEVTRIIESMDSRGAWLEQGVIGKADRIVHVFAAREMVLTINGKPQQVRENDTIELFQGSQPPRQQIIRAETFAKNLETLAAWVYKGK